MGTDDGSKANYILCTTVKHCFCVTVVPATEDPSIKQFPAF